MSVSTAWSPISLDRLLMRVVMIIDSKLARKMSKEDTLLRSAKSKWNTTGFWRKHKVGEKRKLSTYMFALRLKFLQVLSEKDRFARLGWASHEHKVWAIDVFRVDVFEWKHEVTKIPTVSPVFKDWPRVGACFWSLVCLNTTAIFSYRWFVFILFGVDLWSKVAVNMTLLAGLVRFRF